MAILLGIAKQEFTVILDGESSWERSENNKDLVLTGVSRVVFLFDCRPLPSKSIPFAVNRFDKSRKQPLEYPSRFESYPDAHFT